MAKRTAKPAVHIPQTQPEMEARLEEYCKVEAEIAAHEAALKVETAKLSAQYALKLAELKEKLKSLFNQVSLYCAAHRMSLLTAPTKSRNLTTATVGWQFGSKSTVEIEDDKLEEVLAFLEGRAATEPVFATFVRTVVEINKDAMLANRELAEQVPHVKIVDPREKFFIKAAALPIEPATARVEAA
jgi:phage host-nuclease inhibitor protein Gam